MTLQRGWLHKAEAGTLWTVIRRGSSTTGDPVLLGDVWSPPSRRMDVVLSMSKVEPGTYRAGFEFRNGLHNVKLGKRVTLKGEIDRLAGSQGSGRFRTGSPGIAGYQEMENRVNAMRSANRQATARCLTALRKLAELPT